MERPTTYQKMRKKALIPLEMAFKYYSILSAVNGLGLTPRELQLVAFTAIKGNISYAPYKKEFCDLYKSSLPTIANMVGKLRKIKVLIKDKDKTKVNPSIQLDFSNDIVLQIKLEGDGKT